MNKIVILGGGTFSPIRNHLSLAAPAFGTTAKKLHNMFLANQPEGYETKLYLTKMADPTNDLVTNEDVSNLVDSLIGDPEVKTIVMNVALCDFDPIDIGDIGWHGQRLKTSDGAFSLRLRPAQKIISKIRVKRPDIFLVGFKTTTGATREKQFLSGLAMMKSSKCNLVLANDTVTRHNMIITPEEVKYEIEHSCSSEQRILTLWELVDITLMRHNLTYNRTNFIKAKAFGLEEAPVTFTRVLEHVILRDGFIENNSNGFTPGHFSYKMNDEMFVSSQRKVNHNDVWKNGMTLVKVSEGRVTAVGSHKPSVGATSQNLLFKKYPEYDCIIHVHCPLKEGSQIPLASQRPYQCGSLECGQNTVDNIKEFEFDATDVGFAPTKIAAVMLDKHGPNILFRSTDNPIAIIMFIEDNVMLGTKIT